MFIDNWELRRRLLKVALTKMKYLQLFTLHNLALISDWLEESGYLFLDIYIPHSAGDSDKFFVNSLHELKELIRSQNTDEIEITIFRQKQFLLNGVANTELLTKAISQIEDGEDFVIVCLEANFPDAIEILETGDSHKELKEYLPKFFGRRVGIEIDSGDSPWYSRNTKEMFQLSVRMNQNWHENFVQNPERYKHLDKFWQE